MYMCARLWGKPGRAGQVCRGRWVVEWFGWEDGLVAATRGSAKACWCQNGWQTACGGRRLGCVAAAGRLGGCCGTKGQAHGMCAVRDICI